MLLIQIAEWFNSNYEKIWLIVCVIAIIFVALGTITGSEPVFDIGDTMTDFYDEILSE